MNNGESRQEFFISDDGYINIRLKVITDDKIEREKIVGDLMGMLKNDEGFKLSEHVNVDQIYFHNQNPLTVLERLKKDIISDIERVFDESISKNGKR